MISKLQSDHPLEHKQSVARPLIDRASALCSTTKNRQDEIRHVRDTLKLNSYPNTTLIKKPSSRTEQQSKASPLYPILPPIKKKYGIVCLTTMWKPSRNRATPLARNSLVTKTQWILSCDNEQYMKFLAMTVTFHTLAKQNFQKFKFCMFEIQISRFDPFISYKQINKFWCSLIEIAE